MSQPRQIYKKPSTGLLKDTGDSHEINITMRIIKIGIKTQK